MNLDLYIRSIRAEYISNNRRINQDLKDLPKDIREFKSKF